MPGYTFAVGPLPDPLPSVEAALAEQQRKTIEAMMFNEEMGDLGRALRALRERDNLATFIQRATRLLSVGTSPTIAPRLNRLEHFLEEVWSAANSTASQKVPGSSPESLLFTKEAAAHFGRSIFDILAARAYRPLEAGALPSLDEILRVDRDWEHEIEERFRSARFDPPFAASAKDPRRRHAPRHEAQEELIAAMNLIRGSVHPPVATNARLFLWRYPPTGTGSPDSLKGAWIDGAAATRVYGERDEGWLRSSAQKFVEEAIPGAVAVAMRGFDPTCKTQVLELVFPPKRMEAYTSAEEVAACEWLLRRAGCDLQVGGPEDMDHALSGSVLDPLREAAELAAGVSAAEVQTLVRRDPAFKEAEEQQISEIAEALREGVAPQVLKLIRASSRQPAKPLVVLSCPHLR